MAAVPLLSYLSNYAEGKLPYWYPPGPFTLGTNGVGTVEAIGEDVYHFTPGQVVAVSPYLRANEITGKPTQILMGLTGISADSGPMLATWRDGTLSEYVLAPASTVAELSGLETRPVERLATIGKFIVPLGGLLRGRLVVGETLLVNGATGYFGSAAVLLGLALGAECVVAVGRNASVLDQIAKVGDGRVVALALTGEAEKDSATLRSATNGGAHLAFDQVGGATDSYGTLQALKALRRGGRLVLMGSMTAPLLLSYSEVMVNNWEIIGNFMYEPRAFLAWICLVRSGLLNLDAIRVKSFPFNELPAALNAAAAMRGLDCTVIRM
jgi:alcohol dehydrogenase